MRKSVLALAVVASVAFATPLRAATITANAVIDLNSAITGNYWTGFGHPLASPVQVAEGDTVVINIGFASGQALTWDSSGWFAPWLMLSGYFPGENVPSAGNFPPGQEGSFTISSITAAFSGLTQGTQFPAVAGTNSSAAVHLGPTFVFGSDGITRTFTGVTLSFLASFDDGDPFRDYDTIAYDFYPLFEGNVSVSNVSAVPLPAALPLFAGGLGLLGWMARRRRGQVAHA